MGGIQVLGANKIDSGRDDAPEGGDLSDSGSRFSPAAELEHCFLFPILFRLTALVI